MRYKNRGRFNIPLDMIEDRFDDVRLVMARCVVMRAEVMYFSDSVEYFAISKDFKEVKKGEKVPEYKVGFGMGKDGELICWFDPVG